MLFRSYTLSFDGKFRVQPIQLELFETTANHAVLRALSQKFGGEMLYPADMSSLAEKIAANKTVKPLIYESTTTNPLINLKWIFAILAFLLAAEWFVRRYFGAY